jgi:hypothetical protein
MVDTQVDVCPVINANLRHTHIVQIAQLLADIEREAFGVVIIGHVRKEALGLGAYGLQF